jgi:hypothetical protein
MSKKLIASAAAAALALAGLVAMPTVATATPGVAGVGAFSIAINGAATNSVSRDGTTAAKSYQVNVPSADVLRYTAASNSTGPAITTGSVVKIDVQTPGTTDAITVTTTGGVKVVSSTQFAATSPAPTTATGVTSLTVAAADGDATVYAYTTSTSAGTAVISSGGSSQTVHISGLSTFGYKMQLSAPTSAAIGGEFTISGTVKDMFGNDLTTELGSGDFTVTGLGGSPVPAHDTAKFEYSATTKVYSLVIDNRADAGAAAVNVALATGKAANAVTAFGTRTINQFFSVNAVDLATQVTALNAQIAALTAQLAATVTKAKYNKLARKWNRANPSNRVKLAK